MNLNNRIPLLSVLLIAAILTGCQAGDTLVTRDPYFSAPTLNIPDEPEPEISYHPDLLWTPLSVNAKEDTSGDREVESKGGKYTIGKYGIYDENGNQAEIGKDQKMAIAVYCDAGVPLFDSGEIYSAKDYETKVPKEIREVISYDAYLYYNSFGPCADSVFAQDWLKLQGCEIVTDHRLHYSKYDPSDADSSGFRPLTLIITTPRLIEKLQSPYPQATFRFYGASLEDFATADYVPGPPIYYHPEVLWTPMSVDVSDKVYPDTVIETENGNFLIGRYGYYDENGNQIEIAPDQKIALDVFCLMGFPLYDQTMGYDGYAEVIYSELPDEIRAVISEEMFEIYNHSFGAGDCRFLEDWLESQGFEVLKDHSKHYSLAYDPPDVYTYYSAVLIITTPRQLAEFKMPYPQATIRFSGAQYEEFAPEIVNPLQ